MSAILMFITSKFKAALRSRRCWQTTVIIWAFPIKAISITMAQNNILITCIATEDSWGQNWSTKFVVSFDKRIAHKSQNKRYRLTTCIQCWCSRWKPQKSVLTSLRVFLTKRYTRKNCKKCSGKKHPVLDVVYFLLLQVHVYNYYCNLHVQVAWIFSSFYFSFDWSCDLTPWEVVSTWRPLFRVSILSYTVGDLLVFEQSNKTVTAIIGFT